MDELQALPPFAAMLMGAVFCWLITALGAATVFFFKQVHRKVLDLLMGFAAGVMIAASFWSLLAPAIDLSRELGYLPWLWPLIGFLLGGGFVVAAGKLLDRAAGGHSEGIRRSVLLVGSITLHNIPEGLSVGVAFGALAAGTPGCTVVGACLLALGIGLQNFPEGASVALPLRREGLSRGKAFLLGQLSGLVEPLAAILGFFLATAMRAVLPAALAFSAGAMIAVAAAELLPESTKESKELAALGCVIGFAVMMLLDVALG